MGFPHSLVGKESTCNAGDPGLIPGLGRSAGEGIGYPLRYSWASLVAQLVKNLRAMWKTWFDLWVGKIPWRRERLPTPVFWPGEFHGLYSPWDGKEMDMTEQLSLLSPLIDYTIHICPSSSNRSAAAAVTGALSAAAAASAAERSYPTHEGTPCPKASGQEELPHVRGRGQRLRVPGCDGSGTAENSYGNPRSGAAARRSYPTPEEQWLRRRRRA